MMDQALQRAGLAILGFSDPQAVHSEEGKGAGAHQAKKMAIIMMASWPVMNAT